MCGTTTESQQSTLLDGPQDGVKPGAPMIVQVACKIGNSPAKQLRRRLALRVDKSQLSSKEYCALGLYDPELSVDQKCEYLSMAANKKFDRSFAPSILAATHSFVAGYFRYCHQGKRWSQSYSGQCS
ncbi:MAG: hypothetical protein ABJM43_12850 [Paracoccaceae bacterium]